MPLYDYDCAACGRRFELVHGVYAEPPAVCPLCGSGPIRKAISAPAIHYKGSGWAKKERRATATPGGSKTTGDSSTGDAPSAGGDSGSGSGDSDGGSTTTTTSTPAAGAKKSKTEAATAGSTD